MYIYIFFKKTTFGQADAQFMYVSSMQPLHNTIILLLLPSYLGRHVHNDIYYINIKCALHNNLIYEGFLLLPPVEYQ